MATVDLALLKKHVRADDFDSDDTYLQRLLDTASEQVVVSTARSREELEKMGGGTLPLQLQQAILLLAGHWYNQREAVSASQMHTVPCTLDALVKPFRRLVADKTGEEGGT